MWYSAEMSFYMGTSDCKGNYLGESVALQKRDEIFKELVKEDEKVIGSHRKIFYSIWKKGKEKRENSLRGLALHKALENVGLGEFWPDFHCDGGHIDVHASSPEEAKKKLTENREKIFKYCNTAFSTEEELKIKESSCEWLNKYS